MPTLPASVLDPVPAEAPRTDALPDPARQPVYIGSEIYRGSTYGPKHPLAIPRVSTTTDLCRAMGWLPDAVFVTAPMATEAAVTRFHDPAYVAALRRAEATQAVSDADRERYRIGADGNPVYREIYRRPMTSAGGVMLAARLLLHAGHPHPSAAADRPASPDARTWSAPDARTRNVPDARTRSVADARTHGEAAPGVVTAPVPRPGSPRPTTSAAVTPASTAIVHCPGGGTHHGRRDRASGFCYLNDPVLGILTWLDGGLERVVYLDLDAHHGDGVQDAFHADPRVLTVSVHEEGRWPRTGAAQDRAGGSARNLPVPQGCNDTELRWLLDHAILPLIERARPQAIFLQCGADALEEDPLARLSLSNNAHRGVVEAIRGLAPRLLVTGGGGYNPYTVARCWAGVWATLNRIAIPARTTSAAESVLRGLTYNRAAGRNPPEHWFTTLQDAPREGPVREAVRQVAAMAVE